MANASKAFTAELGLVTMLPLNSRVSLAIGTRVDGVGAGVGAGVGTGVGDGVGAGVVEVEIGFTHASQVAVATLLYQSLLSYSEAVQSESQGSFGSGVQFVSAGASR